MKKVFPSIACLASSIIALAQDTIPKIAQARQLPSDGGIDHTLNHHSTFEGFIPIVAITLVVTLIIQLTRYILDYRLKNKIINHGISEQLAGSILGKSAADKKDDSIKWAFLCLALSGGLIASYYTMPLHLHSLATMIFSLGLGYLAYYCYLRRKNS